MIVQALIAEMKQHPIGVVILDVQAVEERPAVEDEPRESLDSSHARRGDGSKAEDACRARIGDHNYCRVSVSMVSGVFEMFRDATYPSSSRPITNAPDGRTPDITMRAMPVRPFGFSELT